MGGREGFSDDISLFPSLAEIVPPPFLIGWAGL